MTLLCQNMMDMCVVLYVTSGSCAKESVCVNNLPLVASGRAMSSTFDCKCSSNQFNVMLCD